MAENSKIQWTDHTFNPWRGCLKVSDGCKNCYAETLSKRNPSTLGIWGSEASGATCVVASESMWNEPLKWNRDAALTAGDGPVFGHVERARVFCASLADVFEEWKGPMVNHKGVTLEDGINWPEVDPAESMSRGPVTMQDVRARLFKLIDATPHLDWLLLTKRPENILDMWPGIELRPGEEMTLPASPDTIVDDLKSRKFRCKHRPNVWLLTSVENQEQADKRIPELLTCRDLSSVLGLSCEPLLGPLNLANWFGSHWQEATPDMTAGDVPYNHGIDWVIGGGESGPFARVCNVDHLRSLRDQCQSAGVPCFLKQLGADVYDPVCDRVEGQDGFVPLSDKKGGDWNEWPDELRVREFPAAERDLS